MTLFLVRVFSAATALALGMSPIVAATSPTPLAPTGRWTLAPAENDCTLSRDYGSPAEPFAIAFRPSWNGTLTKILLVMPDRWKGARRHDPAQVQFGQMPAPVDVKTYSGVASGKRVMTILLPQNEAPDPRTGTTITLKIGEDEPVTLALPDIAAGFAALDKCQDAVMDRLGVFAYERRAPLKPELAARARGPWLSVDDYPGEALAKRQQGDVDVLWRIGLDGLVHDCRVLSSSGFRSLDRASCAAANRLAPYVPATDEAGKPRETHSSRTFVWRIPG